MPQGQLTRTQDEGNGREEKELHTKGDKEKGSPSRSVRSSRRGEDPKSKDKESRALKKPAFKKKSKSGRNAIKASKEKITLKMNYKPLHEQFLTLAQYASILGMLDQAKKSRHIMMLLDLLEGLKKACNTYLTYELIKEGKKHQDYGN